MNIQNFKTSDLPLAGFLKCKGISLADEYDTQTKQWAFQDENKCKELSLLLANGEAMVSVLEYEMHRKNLLSLAKRTKLM